MIGVSVAPDGSDLAKMMWCCTQCQISVFLQLCVILNDMYHMKKTMSKMSKALELDVYYEWLNSSSSSEQLGDEVSVRGVIISPSSDTDYLIAVIEAVITPLPPIFLIHPSESPSLLPQLSSTPLVHLQWLSPSWNMLAI